MESSRRVFSPGRIILTVCFGRSFGLIGPPTPFEGRYRDSLVYERTILPRKRVVRIEVLRSVVYNKEESSCLFVHKGPFYGIYRVILFTKGVSMCMVPFLGDNTGTPAGLMEHVQMKRQK